MQPPQPIASHSKTAHLATTRKRNISDKLKPPPKSAKRKKQIRQIRSKFAPHETPA